MCDCTTAPARHLQKAPTAGENATTHLEALPDRAGRTRPEVALFLHTALPSISVIVVAFVSGAVILAAKGMAIEDILGLLGGVAGITMVIVGMILGRPGLARIRALFGTQPV